MNEEVYIEKEWLTVQNYQFKILVMIAVLAENHLAYRGKLKDMCDFLCVGNQTNNRNKIKEAIAALEAKGDIKTLQEGHTWTLTLSVKAERKQKIIKIRKAWVEMMKSYKPTEEDDSVSWENILKVFVYLCADKKEIKRYDEISKELGIAEKTIRKAVKAILNIEFGDVALKRKLAWLKTHDGDFKVIGQKFDVVYVFE